jgi:zinc protease
MTRIALALLVAFLGIGCSVSRTQPAASAAAPPVRYVLSNGVHVVIQEHTSSEVVALQLWELGLAHYLEHMLFKGTASRPRGFVDREVEGVGGRVNADTSFDYTYYHVVLPAHRAAAGIELLADISLNASLDPEALEGRCGSARTIHRGSSFASSTPRPFPNTLMGAL